jgi:predicted nuclease of predicted toxin-antitoxin system
MRWLVDECVDAALVELLRQAGHDVVAVSYIAPRATDLQVMSRAEAEGRLLLTEDKDFGDLAFRRARRVPGIFLLRISSVQRHRKAERLLAAVDRLPALCSAITSSSRRPAFGRALGRRSERRGSADVGDMLGAVVIRHHRIDSGDPASPIYLALTRCGAL